MIGVVFQFGTKIVEVRIDDTQCLFRTGDLGGAFFPIENLQLDKKGVIREFPDLRYKENWREEATKRFKEKMKTFKTEEERVEYIIEDLKQFGYVPLYSQKKGFRIKKFK